METNKKYAKNFVERLKTKFATKKQRQKHD